MALVGWVGVLLMLVLVLGAGAPGKWCFGIAARDVLVFAVRQLKTSNKVKRRKQRRSDWGNAVISSLVFCFTSFEI